MVVEKNKVVTFHYQLSEPGKEVFETSNNDAPIVYLHGHRGMLPGLEESMAGKKAGESFSATLSPEQAYGSLRDNAVQRISMKQVVNSKKKKAKYKPGMVVQINTSDGPREVVVVKVGLKTMDVDTNHPLAGKTLIFNVDVVDVRDALAEEITHGHVHGEGGHHH